MLGLSFDIGLIAPAAGLEGADAERAADALFRSGLVREDREGATQFVHQLIGQALYDELTPPVRRRLHGRYFALLSARGLEVEAAEHAMRAGLTDDPNAGAVLFRTGQAALAAGAVATATRNLEAALHIWGAGAPPSLRLVLGRALAASGRAGDAAGACAALLEEPALEWTDRVDALRISGRLRGAHAVAAHIAADRDADARRVVEHLETAAAVLPCAWPSIAARLGRACLHAHAGEATEAEATFADALVHLEGADFPLQRADALVAYGGFLRRSGRRADARAPFAEALRIAEECGAAGLAATAQEELALVGGRPRRPGGDPSRLTEAERRVALRAAKGLSNADIAGALYLSAHTVGPVFAVSDPAKAQDLS